VNTVVPPYSETGLVSAIAGDPAARAAIVSRIPVGQAGTSADLEGVHVFLAGADSAFATGAAFAVDGGMTRGGGQRRGRCGSAKAWRDSQAGWSAGPLAMAGPRRSPRSSTAAAPVITAAM
jgi:hypothetical protein